MHTRTKPYSWAERIGSHLSIKTRHARVSGKIRLDETPSQALSRLGFRLVGQFTIDVNTPGRATALVVAK